MGPDVLRVVRKYEIQTVGISCTQSLDLKKLQKIFISILSIKTHNLQNDTFHFCITPQLRIWRKLKRLNKKINLLFYSWFHSLLSGGRIYLPYIIRNKEKMATVSTMKLPSLTLLCDLFWSRQSYKCCASNLGKHLHIGGASPFKMLPIGICLPWYKEIQR